MHTTFSPRNKTLLLAMALPMVALVGCASDKEEKPLTVKPIAQFEAAPEASSLSPVVAEVAAMIETDKSSDTVKSAEDSQSLTEADKFPRIELVDHSKPEKRIFHFKFGTSDLDEAEYETLKQHAKYLQENPQMILQVSGHTDSHGPKGYNRYLSKERAQQVAKLLIEFGAPKAQIHIEGFADERPYAQAKHWKDHRRVELDYDNYELVNKD